DHNKVHLLRCICDEIFGADNFIAQLVWEKKKKGSFLSNDITNVKEYVLVYVKNKTSFSGLIGEITSAVETYPCINAVNKRELRKIPAGISSKYKEKDFFMAKGTEISDTTMSIVLHSDLVIKDGVLDKELILEGNWRYSQNAMEEYAEENKLYITRDLYLRRIVDEVRNKTLKDLLPRVGSDNEVSYKDDINIMNLNTSGWGSNEDADEELRLLFGVQKLLEYPKPSRLIAKLLVSYRNTSDDIFLDFFSGSATTAHAVMNLNAKDGGHRKFIMVQLPEPTNEKSEAYKAGYKNICEIGKERIRRAGDKIKAEAGDKAADLDIGFKVFKLDSSNLQKWNPQPDDLVMTLQQATDNFLPDRTEQDVLYEIMLKMGLKLTCQIEEEQAAGETVYIIGGGDLMICLGRNITTAVAEAVVKLHKEYESELWQVVFRDTGFASDMDKTNVKETLKAAGLDEDSFVCV
ncbi:MAG: DNA methyltransferase, partial [Selenomonadaceae bacterium]